MGTSIPYPIVGIDLDGTITENPLFFQVFTNNWPGKIIIVTFRNDAEPAVKYLTEKFIRFDDLILAKTIDKSEIINNNKINVYFDDQDEMIKNISDKVTVLKVRNGGNFDFDDKKWLYSDKTGKII